MRYTVGVGETTEERVVTMRSGEILEQIEEKTAEIRELLTDLQAAQDESSDEQNEQHIMGAFAGLDHVETHIGDVVA